MKIFIALAFTLLLLGCQGEIIELFPGKLIPVAPFEVRVDLDQKAEKILRERKETIHISGNFAGVPDKNSCLKENNKATGFVFGSFEKELDISDKTLTVRFDKLQVPERIINRLENKHYGIELSVRTGWKSSQFNLLSCDPPLISEGSRQYLYKCKINSLF
ncbi:MAG: hypothetical protein EPN25_08200 [Nitrospirae bacterium]|nr:MAG: hypothetical protein EPN25_08200 [Nitrospirota bacterium]